MVRRAAATKSEATPKGRGRQSNELRPLNGQTSLGEDDFEEDERSSSDGNDGANEEQRQRLLAQGLDELEQLNEEKDAVIARIRNLRKSMKADGLSRSDVDFGLRLRKDGPDAIKEEIARHIKIAEWQGKPLGFQASLGV